MPLATAFLLATALEAQTGSASVLGRVTDQRDAIIPDADIQVKNVDTGFTVGAKSNNDGQYLVPFLNPGNYVIVVSKQGFQTVTITGITLNTQDNLSRNFALQVGSVSESVTVNGIGANVNTTDASVSTVIDRNFAENLPLNGRSFQSLIYLTPGVTLNVGSGQSVGFASGQFTVNGQRASSNYWMVDGVSANIGISPFGLNGNFAAGGLGAVNALGGTNSLVSVDALQEFRIQTSTYAPEFGRTPGGQISITTRSGGNQFHGSLFDYFRNTVLDATDWFANARGLAKAAEQQNDFGGVLGGPIIKNKTFFFFSYEGLRLRQPQTLLTTVPDLATRRNAVPAMQPWINAYPLPNPGALDVPCSPTVPCFNGSSGLAPFNTTYSQPSAADVYGLRIDHTLTKDLNLFLRYNYSPTSIQQRSAGNTANTIDPITTTTNTGTVGMTWSKSSQTVNDARFNYSSSVGKTNLYMDTFGGGAVAPGATLLPSPFTYENAEFAIGPGFGTDTQIGEGLLNHNIQHQYNIVDTLSLQKGSHSLKVGIDYRHLSPYLGHGTYLLYPYFSTVAELAAGTPDFTYTVSSRTGTYLFHNLGVFAQDSWRVSSRLNLTYGLRWDVDFVPSAESGPGIPAVTGFSYTNLSNLAMAPAGTPPYSTRYGNVAPRLGAAYQVLQRPAWGLVLRGGFGVFYDLASTEFGNSNKFYYPFTTTSLVTGVPFPTPASATAPPSIVPPNSTQGTLFGFDPHLNLPYTLEWNVALEQGIGNNQTITASYVGSSGRRLLATESISAPNSNYLSASLVGNAGESNYNALQVQFQRRLSKGLQALASYTWAHSIDTGSYGAYTDGSFANVSTNRGDSDFDIRHTLSAALTYAVPGSGRNAFTRAIFGGWSTENIVQVHSAPPVDVIDGAFAALKAQNSTAIIRPDLVPGQPIYLYGPQYPGGKALNPNAFAAPPVDPATNVPVRQGDLGRNSIRGFGLAQWDFAVHRDFRIREGLKLQFRAELFNVLNHPNFSPYNSSFGTGDPYFGQATSMLGQSSGLTGGVSGAGGLNTLYQLGGPRSIQLALKLVF